MTDRNKELSERLRLEDAAKQAARRTAWEQRIPTDWTRYDDRPEPDPLKADRYFPEEWTPEDEELEK